LLVDGSLHTAFDKYEFLAVTVSLEYGRYMLDFLRADLARRQSVMDETGHMEQRAFQASRIHPLLLFNVPDVNSAFRYRYASVAAGSSAP
jgi:hypothetical protein